MYILYNTGERTELCDTPAYISLGVDMSPMTETLEFSLRNKRANKLIRLIENFNSNYFFSKSWCHVVSKAFSIGKNTASVIVKI
jgi:hypothetical protein